MSTRDDLLVYMQEAKEAGRREMAAAVGVSHVMIGRLVRQLEHEGILREIGLAPSGGGRPEKRYRYNGAHGHVLLFRQEGAENRGHLELLDMQGRLLEHRTARFTHLHAEILDDWLVELTRRWRRKIKRIVLHLPPGPSVEELTNHLHQTHGLTVVKLNGAEALANKRSHTLTLLCLRGCIPHVAHRRARELHPCPHLHLLPLPDRWEVMNYSDRTLIEEMLSRLLQILTCTLYTTEVVLHCDYLTERLISRIRYNLSAKLKGMENPPKIHFSTTTPEQLILALRHAAAREGSTTHSIASNRYSILRQNKES